MIPMKPDRPRCPTCGWPLCATIKEGCTLGNCSQRPAPKREADASLYPTAVPGASGSLTIPIALADQPRPRLDGNAQSEPAAWDLVRDRADEMHRAGELGRVDFPAFFAVMTERDVIGFARYGTRLRAHNGRDALVDAMQEALDLCAYLAQAVLEFGPGRYHGAKNPHRARIALAEAIALAASVHRMIVERAAA